MSPTVGSELNIIDLIKAGEYIQAIKLRREQTGEGLKESKEYIDNLKAGIELKALKCSSIDEMKDKIQNISIMGGTQKDFILDIIDEAFYLGEDSGSQSGYMKALEENDTGRHDLDEDAIGEQAYDEGWADGNQQGRDEGFEHGSEEGYESGYTDGKEEGYTDGKEEGYDDGYNARVEEESQ